MSKPLPVEDFTLLCNTILAHRESLKELTRALQEQYVASLSGSYESLRVAATRLTEVERFSAAHSSAVNIAMDKVLRFYVDTPEVATISDVSNLLSPLQRDTLQAHIDGYRIEIAELVEAATAVYDDAAIVLRAIGNPVASSSSYDASGRRVIDKSLPGSTFEGSL